MDIELPGEKGLELNREIKANHPDIIFSILTSHYSPEYREAATQCKASYFLSKDSIITHELFILIQSVLLEIVFNVDGSDSQKARVTKYEETNYNRG